MSAAVLVVCVNVPGTVRVFAAADPYDAESIVAGAQLYEMYCSECHGSDTAKRYGDLYDTVDSDVSEDYDQLVELARRAKAPPPSLPPEDWPEWALDPPPEREPDIREEVLGDLSSAIERVNGVSLETGTVEYWDDNVGAGSADDFDPKPGSTNLADPTAYFYGTSEEDLFNSIAHGTGAAMPGWRTELGSDEAVWDLVNYIRSLWGEQWR